MGEILAQIQKMAQRSHGPEVTSSNLEFSPKFERKFKTVNLCTSSLPTNAQYKVERIIEIYEKIPRYSSPMGFLLFTRQVTT